MTTTADPFPALFGGSQPLNLLADLLKQDPACQLEDADLFTSPEGEEPDQARQDREALAKAICARCPARAACLDYALTIRPRDGVWAGYTADEINALTRIFARIDLPKEVA
ncbi:WhiB family transcriptional regulator [Nonomuraea longispora]|uniref:WhiB family transcriptional regulator n=1 Tax=Nonomuraea longispora TaxID=1848320 RepID=UPI0014043E27|nr:WhiB family transcriptional regulator [Nonomuraea longispora]